jgi:hypothetical protein
MLGFARGLMKKGARRWTEIHNVINVDGRSNDVDFVFAHYLGESLTSNEEFVA